MQSLQFCNSPGDWARELFKPSTDSASLVVEIENKNFLFSVGGFQGGAPQVGVFLATFTWPWAPTYWAIIMAQDFSEIRSKSTSLQPLNDFLAYL